MVVDHFTDTVDRYRGVKSGKEWNYGEESIEISCKIQNLQLEEALQADGAFSKDNVMYCANTEDVRKNDKIVWGSFKYSVQSILDYNQGNLIFYKIILTEL